MIDTLFHASTSKDLQVLKPRRTLSKDTYIGDYVFATTSKKLAAMYLVTKNVPILMNYRSAEPSIMIVADSKEYAKNDVGGAIYSVASDTFKKSPQTELGNSEFVSSVEVVPISKEIYNTSVEAMTSMDITINFISKERFNELSSKPI